MDIMELGAIGDLVGGIAVLVTLAYLAMQVRQNTAQVRVQTGALEAGTTSQAVDLTIRDEVMTDIFLRATAGEALDPREALRFDALMLMNMTNFENYYRQYRNGLMEEEQWEKWHRLLGWYFKSDGMRRWWKETQIPVSRSLAALIERDFLAAESR